MKLADAAQYLKEVDLEDKGEAPEPIGDTASTKWAAKELGVTVSRVRQMIGDGTLKAKISPRPGDRDHEILKKDVQALKKNMPEKGRPSDKDSDGKEEGKGKSDDDNKSSKGKDKD
jgi:hypothetical protein